MNQQINFLLAIRHISEYLILSQHLIPCPPINAQVYNTIFVTFATAQNFLAKFCSIIVKLFGIIP